MDREMLKQMARHQAWANGEHWKVLHANPALLEDNEIRRRLNHMEQACRMLTTLAQGGTPDFTAIKDAESVEKLETVLRETDGNLLAALDAVDLDKNVHLPRGPKGPWEAPAG